jgi:hypothetical protein
MIIQLINMNISLREYPVEDWVRRHTNFRYHPLWVTSIGVVVYCRCRQMIAVQTRCRWSSRSLVVDVEEVVIRSFAVDVEEVIVQERAVAWRRYQKPYCPPILSRISAAGRGSGGSALASTVRAVQAMDLSSRTSSGGSALAGTVRAVQAMGMQKRAANKGRTERSPKQEYMDLWIGRLRRGRKASLYRRTCSEGGMNLDVLSSNGHS